MFSWLFYVWLVVRASAIDCLVSLLHGDLCKVGR